MVGWHEYCSSSCSSTENCCRRILAESCPTNGRTSSTAWARAIKQSTCFETYSIHSFTWKRNNREGEACSLPTRLLVPPFALIFSVCRRTSHFCFASCSARPDSAPNLQRRPQRDAALSSLEHYNRKRSSPTRLAPRVARLERETHGLLTDCRKAARTRNDTIHGFSEKSRHARKTKEPLTSGRGGHCRRKSDRNAAALSESSACPSVPYVARKNLASG